MGLTREGVGIMASLRAMVAAQGVGALMTGTVSGLQPTPLTARCKSGGEIGQGSAKAD